MNIKKGILKNLIFVFAITLLFIVQNTYANAATKITSVEFNETIPEPVAYKNSGTGDVKPDTLTVKSVNGDTLLADKVTVVDAKWYRYINGHDYYDDQMSQFVYSSEYSYVVHLALTDPDNYYFYAGGPQMNIDGLSSFSTFQTTNPNEFINVKEDMSGIDFQYISDHHFTLEENEVLVTIYTDDSFYIPYEYGYSYAIPYGGTISDYFPSAYKDGFYLDHWEEYPCSGYYITPNTSIYNNIYIYPIFYEEVDVPYIPEYDDVLYFNGQPQMPNIVGYDPEKMTMTGDTYQTEPSSDSYYITFTLNDGYVWKIDPNYEQDYARYETKSVMYFIYKARMDSLPYLNQEYYTYTGEMIQPELIYNTTYGPYVLSVSQDVAAQIPGNYRMVVSLSDPTRYCWYYNDDSYDTINLDWVIDPAVILRPTLSGDGIYYYTGSTISPTLNNYNSSMCSISGDYSASSVGTYTFTVSLKEPLYSSWDNSSTSPIQFTWQIKSENAIEELNITVSDVEPGTNVSSAQIELDTELLLVNSYSFYYIDEHGNHVIVGQSDKFEAGVDYYLTLTIYSINSNVETNRLSNENTFINGQSVTTLEEDHGIIEIDSIAITKIEASEYNIDAHGGKVTTADDLDTIITSAEPGTQIQVVAPEAPAGKAFKKWESNIELTLEQETSSTLTITMPNEKLLLSPVWVTAVTTITVAETVNAPAQGMAVPQSISLTAASVNNDSSLGDLIDLRHIGWYDVTNGVLDTTYTFEYGHAYCLYMDVELLNLEDYALSEDVQLIIDGLETNKATSKIVAPQLFEYDSGTYVVKNSNEHVVTFNPNGGIFTEGDSRFIIVQDGYTIPNSAYPILYKNGVDVVNGWISDLDNGTMFYFNSGIYEDITLYANWATVVDTPYYEYGMSSYYSTTYNGEVQTPNLSGYNPDIMTIGGDYSATDASIRYIDGWSTTYEPYRISFDLEPGYVWNYYGESTDWAEIYEARNSTKYLEWVITPQQLFYPFFEDDINTFTYTGEPITPVIVYDEYAENALDVYGDLTQTDVGTSYYNITFEIKNTQNYCWYDFENQSQPYTLIWQIDPIYVETPYFSGDDTYTYNGDMIEPELINYDDSIMYKSGQYYERYPGDYTFQVYLKDDNYNYSWYNPERYVSYEWHIIPEILTKVDIINVDEPAYGMSPDIYWDVGYDSVLGYYGVIDSGPVWYRLTSGEAIPLETGETFDYGSYKAEIVFTQFSERICDLNTQFVVNEDPNLCTSSLSQLDENSWTVSFVFKPIVRKHTVTTDYNGGILNSGYESEWPITKQIDEGQMIYFNNDMFSSIEEAFTPPTDYAFDCFEINGVRYELNSQYEINGDVTIKLLWKYDGPINLIEKPTAENSGFYTYNGETISLSLNNFDSTKCTISGDKTAKEVGEYHAIISLNDPIRTHWSDNTTDPISISWEIVKLGDIDENGIIDIVDVRLLLQTTLSQAQEQEQVWTARDLAIMDLDDSKGVDVIDVRLLLQMTIEAMSH